jgi:hypothetical protein
MTRDDWNTLVGRTRAVDMVKIVRQHGIELRKEKKEFVGPCPVCGEAAA